MMRTSLLAATALLPLVLVLSACRTGVTMWDTCSIPDGANRTGTDGTYVLVCTNGRWRPIMTNDEFIAITQERPVTIAPVPQPPVEAPPTTVAPPATSPAPPPDTLISSGHGFTCAVVNGAAKCWGLNSQGQLGDAAAGDSTPVPTQVHGLTSGVTAIATGTGHACAVVDGAAKCWGANSLGQLGAVTPDYDSFEPVQVQGLTHGVTDISAGGKSTCAVVDGAAQCWGFNGDGRLGAGTADYDSFEPVQVQGLTSGVTAISAGTSHTCAVVAGAAQCWGWNNFSQIGRSVNLGDTNEPVHVPGLTHGVSSISAGNRFSCAVVAGAAKCWGRNAEGQLATSIDDVYFTDQPIQVGGLLTGVTTVTAGKTHTCAVVDRRVMCWGMNDDGQLGVSPDENYLSETPIAVPLP